MNFVAILGQVRDPDSKRYGAKAATLSRLTARGFPVPEGFVVTTDAFELFVRHHGLDGVITAVLRAAERGGTELGERALGDRAAELSEVILTAPVPESIAAEIEIARRRLGEGPLAVRSSSTLEDRPDLSFAGQHDSFLDVRGGDACLEAVRRVWASLYSPRALATLQALGVSPRGEGMAVLVQAMVGARCAGVGFTANPLSGETRELVLHSVAGLGEDCVNGQRTSHRIVLTRDPLAVAEIRRPTESEDDPLRPADALDVARLLVRAEEEIDCGPLDVEWALSHGDMRTPTGEDGQAVWLLQARPMTAGIEGPGEPGIRWESPVPGARWRRRWRLGEWLREPVTPLFATWAIPRLTRSRERFGTGRLGWHPPPAFSMPAPWHCLLHGYFYARQDLPDNVGAGMPFAARLARVRELRSFLRRFQDEYLPAYLEHFTAHRARDVESETPRELLKLADALLDEAGELWYVLAPLGYGFEAMVFAPHYERLLGDQDPPHYSVLFRGYPNPAVDAQQALYDLARRVRDDAPTAALLQATPPAALARDPRRLPVWLTRALGAHRRDYGHLVDSLDFFFPAAGERPEETLAVLASLVRHRRVEEPRTRLERSRREREEAREWVAARLRERGPEGADVALLMDGLQASAAAREKTIFAFQLGWPLLRRTALTLGRILTAHGVLEEPEQIFFVKHSELVGTVEALDRGEAPAILSAAALRRRATWDRRRLLEPPESIPRHLDNPQVETTCGFVDDAEGARLLGQGVSAGRYRGKVRVVASPAATIARGDVLVTSHASPALTPLMLLAGALVVDVGGGASHSSLIARELGLPTVVNTLEATRRLADGQFVEVDGGAGIVRLM